MTMRTNTGYYHFSVGEFEATAVNDGSLEFMPAIAGYAEGTPEEALIATLHSYLLPIDRMTMYGNALVLRTENDLILIDTGTGAGILPTAGHLKANLQTAGISPEEITAVLLTHAHPDHIGGLIFETGELNYPNARYFMSEAEWNYWTDPELDLTQIGLIEGEQDFVRATVKRHLPPIQERLTLVKPGNEILPGIRGINAPGHTIGHMAFLITSNGESLLHIGDAAHHAILTFEHPEWRWRGDYDADQHIASRRRLLDHAAAERLRVFGYHLPFPGLGYVRSKDDVYAWLAEPMDLLN